MKEQQAFLFIPVHLALFQIFNSVNSKETKEAAV